MFFFFSGHTTLKGANDLKITSQEKEEKPAKAFWHIFFLREPLLVLLVKLTTAAAYVYLDPVFKEFLHTEVCDICQHLIIVSIY